MHHNTSAAGAAIRRGPFEWRFEVDKTTGSVHVVHTGGQYHEEVTLPIHIVSDVIQWLRLAMEELRSGRTPRAGSIHGTEIPDWGRMTWRIEVDHDQELANLMYRAKADFVIPFPSTILPAVISHLGRAYEELTPPEGKREVL